MAWHFLRHFSLALLLLVAGHVRDGEGRMSEREFAALLHRFRENGRQLSDEQFHVLYQQVNTMFWSSPDSVGTGASGLDNVTYSVILYEIPPFVRLTDFEAVEGDPGNVNQTRTSRNGGISGITIDFLSLVEYHTGAHFRYYYPCRKLDLQFTGKCNAELVRRANESLAMLDSGISDEESVFVGGGRTLCGSSNKCFSAGAHKISESLLINYYLTQPIMMTGYRLATLAVPSAPTLFEWASPFDYVVWIVIGFEILICAVAIYAVEYRADNDCLATNPLERLWDTLYYSMTILLGVADKQPVTHGGRTIVLAQLFTTMILQAVFTGNLNNILLRTPLNTIVESFQDYTNPQASKFNPRNSICYPVADLVAKNYLDLEAGLHQDVQMNIITAPDVQSCLQLVYKGEVTATFYDDPVLQAAIGTYYLQTGKCGLNGGYCSEWRTSAADCHCNIPQPGCNTSAQECPEVVDPLCNRTFTPSKSSMTLVGDLFNPVGYALVFPRSKTFTDHLAFNQVLLYVREQGELQRIIESQVAMPKCASDIGVLPQVELTNMVGLIIVLSLMSLIGVGTGYIEIITRILRKCGCHGIPDFFFRCCEKEEEPEPPKEKKKMPYANLAPPVLPTTFDKIPIADCLAEIKGRLADVEKTLQQANAKAGAAIEIFERSMPP